MIGRKGGETGWLDSLLNRLGIRKDNRQAQTTDRPETNVHGENGKKKKENVCQSRRFTWWVYVL